MTFLGPQKLYLKCLFQNDNISAPEPQIKKIRPLYFLQLLKLKKIKCLHFLISSYLLVSSYLPQMTFCGFGGVFSILIIWQNYHNSPGWTLDHENKCTFPSTFRVDENKVPLFFGLDVIWGRYELFVILWHQRGFQYPHNMTKLP